MSKFINNETGNKLRFCRKNCGLSQQQIADSLGIDRTTYTYYESGRSEPNLTTLVKLAQIFCVDVNTLLPNDNTDLVLRDTDSNSPNPIYSLTKEEQKLLLIFRTLSKDEKAEVLDKITNISDSKD
ncbi:MAG: helix-turn-helix transcriptional regulator [Ruminococcus sp.]|nr:helix-turn-helix transcriptional regulator [Ruminococcus sp.]